MSDSGTEWRAEEDGINWIVCEYRNGKFHRCLAANLDKPTAHRIAAVNELEAALKSVDDWIMSGWSEEDVEGGAVHPAFRKALKATRAALAKARGDQ